LGWKETTKIRKGSKRFKEKGFRGAGATIAR